MFAAETPNPRATPNSVAASPPQAQVTIGTSDSGLRGVSRACAVEGTRGWVRGCSAAGAEASAGSAPASGRAGFGWANASDDRETEMTIRMASPRRKGTRTTPYSTRSARLGWMREVIFTVREDEAGVRLDAYLRQKLRGPSRCRIQRMIREQLRPLGKERLKPASVVRPGLRFAIAHESPVEDPLPKIQIVHEDEAILVLEKPAN